MENCNTKYIDIDGDDIMVDDFVWVESETRDKSTQDNVLQLRLIDFCAFSIARIAEAYVSQPFDTVKVKQQTFPNLYMSMWRCFAFTYRNYGLYRGLYAGTIPAVVTGIVQNSVLLGIYGGCQTAIARSGNTEDARNLSVMGNACAGSMSALFSTFICPTELMKCKLQAIQEMKRYVPKGSTATVLTPYKLIKRIFQNEGIAGFYRGLSSTFSRDIPGYFVFFGSYEAARVYFSKEGESKDDIGPWKTMLAGSVGSIIQNTITFPADVIKSRIQIQNLNKNITGVAFDILKNEGIPAFYSGLLPTMLRTLPATCTLFLVYEYTKKMINAQFLYGP